MDYKKILILLLSIINIAIVLALLIKPIIETKEDFNDTCSPPDDPIDTTTAVTTQVAEQDEDVDTRDIHCNKFLVVFLIKNPDNCEQDRIANEIYDDYFTEQGIENNLEFTDTMIRRIFSYRSLPVFRNNLNLRFEPIIDQLNNGEQASPILLIKRFNSDLLELHANGRLNAGQDSLAFRRFLNIDGKPKAIDFINTLKCQYDENSNSTAPCTAPEVCTVPTTAAGTTAAATTAAATTAVATTAAGTTAAATTAAATTTAQ